MKQDIFYYPLMKIGIIGGGQLGKMMTQQAKKMGFYVTVLDPTPGSPAGQVADKQIVGDFYNEQKLRELVNESDVTTYDIEHINTEALKQLENEGHHILPSPRLLEIIQDKLKQKEALTKKKIPVPRYEKVETPDPAFFEKFGFPLVQKARKGGYDGRGVVVLRNKANLENAIKAESFIEEFVDFEKELAVIVARNTAGETRCYPVVEMVFDERANICDLVIAPARITKEVEEQAKEIAVNCVEILDGVGVFGVELFLTREGQVLVNEIAPRPHNSGHYTIEACVTCQFEQHIRAISGLPLGSTKLLTPAAMINLLGEGSGKPVIEKLRQILSIPGLSFHLYGKSTTKPFRKMGHVTIVDENLERAIEKAEKVKKTFKIKGMTG
ncbi:5-(carboxyamino)imidazole ribonucleotide synthase [Caldithrix abyssi]